MLNRFLEHVSGGPAAPSDLADMNIDGTQNSPAVYQYVNITSGAQKIQRLNVIVWDNNGWPADGFGAAGTELSNGIDLEYIETNPLSAILNLTHGRQIKRNIDWAVHAQSVVFQPFSNALVEGLQVVWEFDPIITLRQNQAIRASISDNLTGLLGFRMLVTGK